MGLGGYDDMTLTEATTFYRERYVYYRRNLGRRESIAKATSETAARFGGDNRLASAVAVYAHTGEPHDEQSGDLVITVGGR